MPLAPGTHLGPYEIAGPLGSGGMGEVYRARDTRLERTVAIKILPAQFSSDPVRKQRFEREAKTISSLNHPHICVLHDVGHQDGMDYLVMEYVEGETLARRLEKGPLPLEQVLKFGAQIADALDKAHRSGIVHRDLKPGNIMLTPAGAKLLDFGLAKPAAQLASVAALTAAATQDCPVTEQGTIVGTFQYMSPEQVEGKEVDGRSDIFSLGAVLYEMVTGKRAFEGKSQLSVASAILEKEPEPISAAKPMTPPALDHAVRKCLAKLPDERWQSASDLASELKWISESGSQVGAAGRVPARGKRWERASWLAATTFFLLLMAVGVSLWTTSNKRPHPMCFHTSVERRLLLNTSANAAYAEPGYLLYLRDKTLVAQPFDRRRYVLSGEPHTLSDEVLYTPLVDRAVFSVSSGEVLVTQTGKGASLSQLTWFDRSGKPAGTVGIPGSFDNVRLSPDGHSVAADQTDADGWHIDIWIHEPARGATTRLTFDPSLHQTPIWSPDGKQVLFSWARKLGSQLYLKNADGSGSEEEVADLGAGLLVNPWDWSRDGKYALVRKANELWYLSWPERVAKPLLQAKWTVRNAQFSADGRWIAYASNETGSWEIYVSPFLSANGKWQVSSAGGQEPKWRQDGKELFYLSAEGKMMGVELTTGTSFNAGSPVALFQTHRRQPISAQDHFSYDVSGDGQRFLIATKVDEANAAPPSVLLNWASEMEN